MPIHDWKCSGCGAELLDRYQPRTDENPPICPNVRVRPHMPGLGPVGEFEEHEMERLWSTGASHKPFEAFDLDVPGQGNVRISDIHQLRRAEKAAAEHGQPIAVRQYSMDRGNGPERNCFGQAPNREQKLVTRSSAGIPFRRMIETRD